MISIFERKVLILGVGNILMRDEGIGVRVIEAIQENYDLPDNIQLLDGGTAGYTLIDYMDDFDRIIIIDAVRSGSQPGDICRLSPEDIAGEKRLKMSGHKIELPELLALGQKLGKLPETTLIGIEPEDISWGMELTPALKSAITAIIETAFEEISIRGEDYRHTSKGDQACA
ncbi:MAG: HyaD/HybD family hydrogenase maturation endopeptidase [Proteobacteria bacterium]|nr:HyaD/HybD family hydrogenase maturation endopeptidase [Pseudomonadota bacterium]